MLKLEWITKREFVDMLTMQILEFEDIWAMEIGICFSFKAF